jgi:hypothetical protein
MSHLGRGVLYAAALVVTIVTVDACWLRHHTALRLVINCTIAGVFALAYYLATR